MNGKTIPEVVAEIRRDSVYWAPEVRGRKLLPYLNTYGVPLFDALSALPEEDDRIGCGVTLFRHVPFAPTLDPTASDLLRRARLPGCATVLDRDPGAALLIRAMVTDVARNALPYSEALARLRAAEAALLPLARAEWDGRAAKGESGEQMGERP